MSFAEFWALTPADVVLAANAHEARERAADLRAGRIAAAVVNVHGGKAKPEDFVPKTRRQTAQTPEQMANALRSWTLAMGGTIDG